MQYFFSAAFAAITNTIPFWTATAVAAFALCYSSYSLSELGCVSFNVLKIILRWWWWWWQKQRRRSNAPSTSASVCLDCLHNFTADQPVDCVGEIGSRTTTHVTVLVVLRFALLPGLHLTLRISSPSCSFNKHLCLLQLPRFWTQTFFPCIGVLIRQKHLARRSRTNNQRLLSTKQPDTIHWLLDVSTVALFSQTDCTHTLVFFFELLSVSQTHTEIFSQLLLLCVSVWFLCFCLRSNFSFQCSILRLSLLLYGNSHPSVSSSYTSSSGNTLAALITSGFVSSLSISPVFPA